MNLNENPEINSHKYDQLCFYNGTKAILSFQQMMLEQVNINGGEKLNLHLNLTSDTKINSKLKVNQNLEVKHKTIKCLEDNVRENYHYLGLGKKFLNMTLKIQSIKQKSDKLVSNNI